MVKIVDGDLLSVTTGIIGQQVNCKGVMGGGVALQVKNKYYEVYKLYNDLCLSTRSEDLLGHVQLVSVNDELIIANIFGQDSFGFGKQQTDVEKLKEAFTELALICKIKKQTLALPYNIGCFRGGANWKEVFKIIEEVFKDVDVTLYRLDRK